MAKDKKGKKKDREGGKRKGDAAEETTGVGEGLTSGAPEAWVGRYVKLRHPVNLNSSLAVGSSAGLLEEAGERGVVLLKRDQRYFYPWSSVFFLSLDERAEQKTA